MCQHEVYHRNTIYMSTASHLRRPRSSRASNKLHWNLPKESSEIPYEEMQENAR